jgi:hypothetical protein
MALTHLVGDNVITGVIVRATTSGAILLGNGGGSFIFGAHSTAVRRRHPGPSRSRTRTTVSPSPTSPASP